MASMVVQTSSTSTPPPPPPPPLNHPIKYDVFLSFRGADTRTKFTDHLYNELHVRKGIPTFRDSEELEKGEDLSQLFEAIEKSKIAVVILSSNYASSTWCLREVAKIVECRKKSGLIALPVFDEIEPTQVRYQTGSFKIHFDKHEQKFKDSIGRVNIWREALTEVADLSGWDLKDRSQTTVIEEIVKCVDTKWKIKFNPAFSIEDSKDFVGMDRVRKIELDLDIETLDKIGVIGICGMPGVGKTTIAEVVFRRNWHHFEANSFLTNVGEIRKTKGLLHIQKQLYRDLLDSKVITMNDVPAARRKLRHKKVFIILDGVTELESIVELAGRGGEELINWFGRGSRIIITTINEKLLKDYEAKTHKVETLSENEPRLLFFRKAFNKDHPLHDCPELDFKFKIDHTMRQYAELAYKFVDLTDGLPLAIVVLGSLLLNRSLDEWEAELRTLEANNDSNDEKTFGILKLCIDGLRDGGKEIFLDIACFFKGDDKKRVERIFESCGHNPGIELNILIEKSLVTIVGGKLWMHDLLQKAGQKMVIGQSKLLGERSRLWDRKEAVSVLKHDKGTSAVQGIFLSSPQLCKVRLKADSFAKMDFLRLLKIKNVIFSGCHEYYLSNELSFLEWHGFPSTSLPSNFEPENLVELHLPRSQIKQLWEDNVTPPLEKLVVMDLSDCKELTSTPDFQSVENLESLILKGCTRLSEVDLPNGNQLQKLIALNLEGCESLSSLPNGICSLRSLTTFILSGCSRLANLPDKIGENMKQLSELDLEGTAIKGLPASIRHLTGLVRLNLKDCKNLLSLPADICSLTKLQVLNLSGCSNLAELPENLGDLVGLKELDASRSCIRQVPSSIIGLKDLESLSFCESLSSSMGLQLPASFSGLDSLTKLDLSYCKLSDGAIPADLDCLSSLSHLSLSGNSLVSVPESITKLSKLEVLLLNDCSELRSLPDLPSSIRRVFARNCPLLGTYSNKITVWSSTATGFCFINCQSSEERKLHRIPISEQHLLRPYLQKFYEDIIYKGSSFEYITPHTEIPSWFGRQSTGSSIKLQLPLDYFDGKRELMGLALCFVYEAQEHENMESTASNISAQEVKYSCNYSCRLSTYGGPHDDCPLLVCKLMDHDYVGSFRHWVYVAGGLFAERLIKRFVRAEVKINRPGVEVKACGASLIYAGGVTEFVWNLNLRDEIHMRNLSSGDQREKSDDRFNKQEQETISDHQPEQYQTQKNLMTSVYDPKRSYNRSLDLDARSSSRTSSSIEEPHQAVTIYGLSRSLILRGGRISACSEDLHTGIFLQKEIPDCFTPHHSASMVPELPRDLENDMNLMGFVVCAAFSVHASKADVLKYLDSGHHPQLMCELKSSSDYSGLQVSNMVDISPKSKFMWFYRRGFIWLHYVRRHEVEHFFKKLSENDLSELEVSFGSDSSQVLAVQKCGFRFLYKQDIEGVMQTILECVTSFDDQEDIINAYIKEEHSGHNKWPNHGDEMGPSSTTGRNIIFEQTHNERLDVPITDRKGKDPSDVSSDEADERDYYGTTPVCQGETSGQASDQLELVTHVVEEEHGSSSSPPELIPFLFEIEPSTSTDSSSTKFEGDQFRTNVETQLAVMVRDKIEEYDFEHGFILSPRVGAILPWFNHQTIGSEALVLHLPPDLYKDKKWKGLALYVAFTVPPGYSENILCRCSLSTSAGHAEAITIACSQGNFSGSRRLCFIHKPRARFPEQWNTCSYISAFFEVLTPVVDVEMCGVHLLYEQDLIGIIQTITQCTIRSPPVYYGVGRANTPRQSQMGQPFADVNMDTNLNEHAARTPSTAQEPVKTLVGQVIHLRIHGDTPFKKKDSVMEWKKNLQFLLRCFFRFPLSITLTLGGDVISSLGDSDPYCLCSSSIIPQKDIPKWFCGKYPTNNLKTTLPRNLENDENWLGFVVCAAFSVHALQADILGYLDSENYPKLTCLLQWDSERALNLKVGKKTSIVRKNKFMWLYLRRFIWLRYIPRQKFKDRLHISDHLDASFRTDSISSKVLGIQECSLRVLYKKDVEEFKQTIIECFTSFFDNEDVIRPYIEEEPRHCLNDDGLFSVTHDCIFPQKKIPDWFKEKSLTSTYVYRLPDDLKSDNNWMGLVVCAAFSVHPLPTDLDNYKDSELSSLVNCNFRWSFDPSRYCSVRQGEEFGVWPNNKFMWLSRRGFIWLKFIPGIVFKIGIDKHCGQLEASFESRSPALTVQECSYRILYKQDLQEYKQTIMQCFEVFDNLDHSLPYKEDDSRHNEEPIHEDDKMDSLGTTSFSKDTQHGRETTVALPESETSGNSFNLFNSILFEPILYDNKTAVIFADFRGWEE